MFKYLKGIITDIKNESVILENNGVGFEIMRLLRDNFDFTSTFKVYICESFSLENNLILYGFLNINDLIMYKKLLLVNGIGYKTAFQILNKIDALSLANLIINNKIEELKSIGNIGKKANILIYELKNKLHEFDINVFRYENVYKALKSLGYNETNISKALYKINANLDDEIALKEAIKVISNG